MLSWLFPRCPLDPLEKAWIETRMLWLAEQQGLARLMDADVLAVQQVVVPDYSGGVDSAQQMLSRLCELLDVAPEEFQLQVVGASCSSEPVPPSPGKTIQIADQLLPHPVSVAAALARGLALLALPLQGSSGTLPGPAGWLADLAAVYQGWGPVVAHAADSADACGGSCGSTPPPAGSTLPARMVGYALALFAYVRQENQLEWKEALRMDALAVFQPSLNYLRRTGDTLFDAERAGRKTGERPTAELLFELRKGSPSARIAALWELRDARHAPEAVEAVIHGLHHRVPAIREEATRTIGVFGNHANAAVPALIELLDDRRPSIRDAAIRAWGEIGAEPDQLVAHVAPLLQDPNRQVVLGAALTLEKMSDHAGDALPQLLKALRVAVIRCDHHLIDALTNTLYAIDSDPTDRVMQFFGDDPELCEQVVHVMVDALESQGRAGHGDADIA